jgi:hypothetical protein
MKLELIINKEKIMSTEKDGVEQMLKKDRLSSKENLSKQYQEALYEVIEGLTLRLTSFENGPFQVKIKKGFKPTEKRPKFVRIKKVQGKITSHSEIFSMVRRIVENHFLAMTKDLHQTIESLASLGNLQIPYSLSVSIRNNELCISIHDSQYTIHERSPIPDPQSLVIQGKRKRKQKDK